MSDRLRAIAAGLRDNTALHSAIATQNAAASLRIVAEALYRTA